MTRPATCLKPLHRECRCCRPEGHDGACNCRFPWGPPDDPWGPPAEPVEESLPDSFSEAEEHTDRMERWDDERLAADAGRAREALVVVVLGLLLAAGSAPASVWAVLS